MTCGRLVVFSRYGTPVSSTIKPVCDDIAEILLKVALSDHDGLCFVLEQHNELVVYSASSL